MPIEETELYRLFDEVSDWGWEVVKDWDWFAKKAFGAQLTSALDSVVANLVEGDGRYKPNDALHFFVIARASARESRMWILKASKRNLVEHSSALLHIEKLDSAGRQLNRLIDFRRRSATSLVREERVGYGQDLEEVMQ